MSWRWQEKKYPKLPPQKQPSLLDYSCWVGCLHKAIATEEHSVKLGLVANSHLQCYGAGLRQVGPRTHLLQPYPHEPKHPYVEIGARAKATELEDRSGISTPDPRLHVA